MLLKKILDEGNKKAEFWKRLQLKVTQRKMLMVQTGNAHLNSEGGKIR